MRRDRSLKSRKCRSVWGWLLLTLFTCLGVVLTSSPLLAQIPGLNVSGETVSSIPNIPTKRIGNLEIAPVFLDGVMIREISAAIGFEESQEDIETRDLTAAYRSQYVSNKLQQILDGMGQYTKKKFTRSLHLQHLREVQQWDSFDLDKILPKRGLFAQQIKALNRQLLLNSEKVEDGSYIIKAAFPRGAPIETVVTVTKADALFQQTSTVELAQRWTKNLQIELLQGWLMRQPIAVELGVIFSLLVVLTVVLLTLIIRFFQFRLRRSGKHLQAQASAQTAALQVGEEGSSQTLTPLERLTAQMQKLAIDRNYSVNKFLRGLLYWGQILLWFLGSGLICFFFPFSRPLANFLLGSPPLTWLFTLSKQGYPSPLLLLLLLFFTVNLIDRTSDLLIDRLAKKILENQAMLANLGGNTQRYSLRIPTLATAAKGVTTVVAYVVFILTLLSQFKAIATPITALLGILTFGISLGAQNFIRDVINGIFILVEDQYAVGDVISVNGNLGGYVEYLNLRMTQLRNLEGELITIPNGTISTVQNMTNGWSQAKCVVNVSHETDVDKAMTVMTQVAQDLYTDPDWEDLVLDEPELLGIDNLDYTGVQLVILLKTQPIQQWTVAREYRHRLNRAFAESQIPIAFPGQKVLIENVPPI
ncbi:mechanosensitive ion channel family protein [Spirulina sp. CS-785/01]|uniref:mechanosensitive ion channel family protein n=1 Tax=Spirulina sp. CS-785/01 TaxID=3021716 RepID=UPI00232FB0DC|nr:mechanosensitive ion channel family protein [Spirulina sp. CS-785/01]MDB9313743.1 mechanosensitive ion channel family protein [Spirulina sp. CS-785/01]